MAHTLFIFGAPIISLSGEIAHNVPQTGDVSNVGLALLVAVCDRSLD